MGDLKIVLLATFTNDDQIPALKRKVEDFINMNPSFVIERLQYDEYAKRPSEDMLNTTMLDVVKKLDEVKEILQ